MPDLALACVPSSMEWAVFADHLMGLGLAERTVTYYVRRARHADEWLREQGSDLRRAKAALIAGLPYLTTHQLRHTSLATANDNLGDLRAVMEFARHADPGVTSGYTRTSARRLQDVVRALNY